MNTRLVFDIETVPDVELGRRLHGLDGLADAQVGKAMQAMRRQETGNDFLPHEQQQVVAISCVLREGERLKVWSLGEEGATEGQIIQRFFDGIDRYTPDLVSWNGSGFDLPVLHYRAMKWGVQAPRYWEQGEDDTAFRWNNYISRYHARHTDLMDVISSYQGRGRVSLANMAALLGFPGKLGFSGDRVWDAVLEGKLSAVRDYCETDVLNTWLILLRFELFRGRMTPGQHALELELVRSTLRASPAAHLQEFLAAWEALA
jgi:predicted PolB exonuclease-like 3'-5' exonuclease